MADKSWCAFNAPLTDQRLHGGNLAQVLQQLVDGVIVLGGDGVLVVQQQLTGEDQQLKLGSSSTWTPQQQQQNSPCGC